MTVKELIEKLKYPTQIRIYYENTKTCCCFESTLYGREHQNIIERYGDREVVCFDIESSCYDIVGSYCLCIEV